MGGKGMGSLAFFHGVRRVERDRMVPVKRGKPLFGGSTAGRYPWKGGRQEKGRSGDLSARWQGLRGPEFCQVKPY